MSNRSFTFCLVLLLIAFGIVEIIHSRALPVVVQTNLEKLPLVIAGFQGTEDSFPETVYKILNADKHVYRHYRNQNGDQLELYIGYYGTAKGGRTGHNPYACLPGAGWTIVENGQVKIRSRHTPQGTRVNYVVASKDGIRNVMLHWYQSAGTRVLATGLAQNLQRFKGRVFSNRNDGAFVRVSTLVNEQENSRAQAMVQAFAQEVLDLLPAYWPEEN